jgi:hypothetical protein
MDGKPSSEAVIFDAAVIFNGLRWNNFQGIMGREKGTGNFIENCLSQS